MSNPLKNNEGEYSGAKSILLLSSVLAAVWAIRDLISNADLTESHVALIGLLLVTGLINRVSARGSFKLRLGHAEIETKGDSRDDHR